MCHRLFLSTLGYTSDKVIKTVHQKAAGKLNTTPDQRGRHEPSNKLSEATVKSFQDHIKLYNPCITHYRRKHEPNHLYISPLYSSRKMHKDFNETHESQSFSYTLLSRNQEFKYQLRKTR